MSRACLVFSVLTVTLLASPGRAAPDVPRTDGLKKQTPTERYARGEKLSGAFPMYDGRKCSTLGANRAIARRLTKERRPSEVAFMRGSEKVTPRSGGAAMTVAQILDRTLVPVNQTIKQLQKNGDVLAGQRHMCVGALDFKEGRARIESFRSGHVVLDPQAYFSVAFLTNPVSSPLDFMMVHQLSHQIQGWYGNKYETDPNPRRTELSATCLTAALIEMRVRTMTDTWSDQHRANVLRASITVGDLGLEPEPRRGTSAERLLAATAGLQIAEQAYEKRSDKTSEAFLAACSKFVKAKDRKNGINWLPEPRPPASSSK